MKRAVIIFLLLTSIICQPSLFAEEPDQQKTPKVGLVLSGGGAKGAAHIGVLKYLEEIGMPIDIIVGTSMGAIIGGLYSMGYSADELDSLISVQDWGMVMSNRADREEVTYQMKKHAETFLFALPFTLFNDKGDQKETSEIDKMTERSIASAFPSGFISGQNVFNLINGLSVGYQDSIDFKSLPIPYACISYDLASGSEVVMDKGILPQAIRASMAIPGVFAPVNDNGMVLVDGGVINNYPVDVARAMGADIVIGVIVSAEAESTPENLQSLPDIFNQLISLMGREKHKENLKITDVIISPDITGFSTLSFDQVSIDSLVKNGYTATEGHKEALMKIKETTDKFGKVKQYSGAPFALDIQKDSIRISSIELNGIDRSIGYKMLKKTNILSNKSISGKEIDALITMLYGTKAFSSVSYILKGDGEPYHLVVNCEPAYPHQLSVGFRFGSEESAAILLQLGLNTYTLTGHKLTATGRLSYNSYGKIDYGYAFGGFPQFNLSYMFKKTEMNIFDSGALETNLLYNYNLVETSFSGMNLKKFDLRLGGRLEDFNFKRILSTGEINFNKDSTSRTFLSPFVSATMDTRDKINFPTRGHRANAEFSSYLLGFRTGYKIFSALQFEYTGTIPLGNRVTLMPSVYGRFLFGDVIPIAYVNMIGGSEFGRYMTQQMPFIGITYADTFDKFAAVGRLDLRVRMWKKHYVTAQFNVINDARKLQDVFINMDGFWGAGLKYSFDSVIGPLSINGYWSNKSKKPGVYLNVGYFF